MSLQLGGFWLAWTLAISIQTHECMLRCGDPSQEFAMPEKTLADTLAANESLYVNCGHPICCRSTRLDVQALIDKLGADHGSMPLGSVRIIPLFGLRCCGPRPSAGVLHLRSGLREHPAAE